MGYENWNDLQSGNLNDAVKIISFYYFFILQCIQICHIISLRFILKLEVMVHGWINYSQLRRWVSKGKMKHEIDRQIGVAPVVLWLFYNMLSRWRGTEPQSNLSLIFQPSKGTHSRRNKMRQFIPAAKKSLIHKVSGLDKRLCADQLQTGLEKNTASSFSTLWRQINVALKELHPCALNVEISCKNILEGQNPDMF